MSPEVRRLRVRCMFVTLRHTLLPCCTWRSQRFGHITDPQFKGGSVAVLVWMPPGDRCKPASCREEVGAAADTTAAGGLRVTVRGAANPVRLMP